jgi:uncharacterized phage-associated protein
MMSAPDELTHKEKPWRETRQGIPPGDPCDRVIKKELMQEYYSELSLVTGTTLTG